MCACLFRCHTEVSSVYLSSPFLPHVLRNVRLLSVAPKKSIAKCFRTLGLPVDSDQELVRKAFIELVKRFHPDSKTEEADATKFTEIEVAYRTLQEEFARKRFNTEEGEGEYGIYYKEKTADCVEQDIKHTAPQHRQYLSHHGYGMGTPFQREKQFAQHRASKAAERVTEYKISRIANKDSTALQKKQEKSKVRDIRTGFGMERLVEDLIQESMSRGEFDNLGGKGKPLSSRLSHNPYVDFVTHKMNEVLIDNGFTPQWITLQKEIREHKDQILENLKKGRAKIGSLPLSDEDEKYWLLVIERSQRDAEYLNSKIDFYNLVVPILNKQMTHFNINMEAAKILRDCSNIFSEGNAIDKEELKALEKEHRWWDYLVSVIFGK